MVEPAAEYVDDAPRVEVSATELGVTLGEIVFTYSPATNAGVES